MPTEVPTWEESEAVPTWEESEPMLTQIPDQPAKSPEELTLGNIAGSKALGTWTAPPEVGGYTTPTIPFTKLVPEEDPRDPTWVNTLTAVPRSLAKGVLSVPEFLTSPVGVGAAVTAPLAPALTSAAFTVDMARNLLKQYPEVKKAWPNLTTSQKLGAVSDMAIQGVFAGLAGVHAGKGAGEAIGRRVFKPKAEEIVPVLDQALEEPKPSFPEQLPPDEVQPVIDSAKDVLPMSAKEVDKTTTEKGAEYAIPEQKPDEIPVQPAPRDSEAMGEGVRETKEVTPGTKEEVPQEVTPTQVEASKAASERSQEIVKPKGPTPAIRVGDKTFGAQSHVQALSDAESQLGRPLKPEEIERGWMLNDKMFILEETPKEKAQEAVKPESPVVDTRIREDLPEAKPIIDRIDEITKIGEQRHNKMPVGQVRDLTHPFDLLTEEEKIELHELKLKLRPKSAEEARADIEKRRQQRLAQKQESSPAKAKEPSESNTERASILIRVNSHRARDRMKSMLGDIGTNLQKGLGGGEFYAVTPSEFEKIKDVPGISKSKPSPNLGTALFGGEDFEPRYHEARRRLKELVGEKKPTPPAKPPTMEAPDFVAGLASRRPESKIGGIRWDIRNGRTAGLKAKVLMRPVGDTRAIVEINGERFTIDDSSRLKTVGIDTDFSTRKTPQDFGLKTGKDLNEAYNSLPKLALEDFKKPSEPTTMAGPGKQAATDWTSATDEPMELGAGIPIPKFANRKMSDMDKVTGNHSAKLQKSLDEARRAQREIKTEVPSDRRQGAISVWREANGDIPTLQAWAAAARGKLFKQAAIDAQNLTPKELAIAARAGAAFDTLFQRGTRYDVLRAHRDEYVPHVWDVKKPGTGFGGSILQDRFRFSKARTFDTFFEGDQAGYKPKTLAIGKLLPAYIHEMNKVIADRQFVKELADKTASDDRPLVLPRGTGKVVESDEGRAYLMFPRGFKNAKDAAGNKIEQGDYRAMEGQPALHAWRWVEKDAEGNPILMQDDLVLHPEAYRRLNAMLGQSALRQWYRDPVTGTAQIPRAVARGLDKAQSMMKQEMFGFLAPFHQVQEGTHAVGHLVNPFFNIPKIDLRDAGQMDAAKHGLMLLPDRASAGQYLEGSGTHSSLLSKGISKLTPVGRWLSENVIDRYQDYLFHQYIPGLKYKTYEAMLGRNMKLYANELSSGEMTPADVKITSAEQANAAYGHLNYAMLDRNPTMQHLLQLVALAPDFLEARGRFVGQGIKGITNKVGHEQMKAIVILAGIQAGAAYTLSQLMGDKWDWRHPFEVTHNNRTYTLRSVPEDLMRFGIDVKTMITGGTRGIPFISARENPMLQSAIQLGTGRNYRGEPVTALDTAEEFLAKYIPITARQIPGLRDLTSTSKNSPTTPIQQLAGSLGLKISRHSPISETYSLAGDWMKAQNIDRPKGVYPVSKYQQLRYALEDGDMARAREEYLKLAETEQPGKIFNGFRESINHPFTGKASNDELFANSLKGDDRKIYDLAKQTRLNILNAFYYLDKRPKP